MSQIASPVPVSTFTSTGVPPRPTGTTCEKGATYGLPILDTAACAISFQYEQGYANNATAALRHCCNGAPIVLYRGDCSAYCVARQQTQDQLLQCLSNSFNPTLAPVICASKSTQHNGSSTETNSSPSPSKTGAASAIAAEGASKGAWVAFAILATSFMLGVAV
ncbi:hypothetical protein NA57DRAFT_53929 [Rhizodiscina lignyota]|uniref:Uncharacterized protein n=1 Tax=Rhizodiscina lignyota TaxID=1504668 RepID=A0A9P4IM84_9PEZI|nr:hypothetical protein NA57DRAFT_53929 [Rhizodiscina lignyota]